MFRCPSCGQAQEMAVGNGEYLIHSNTKCSGFGLEVTYIATHEQDPSEWIPVDVAEVDAYMDRADAQYPNGVTCTRCTTQNLAQDWFWCWKDPLRYLESENLCHCGGELYLDKIANSIPATFGYVCEQCDWVKPKARVSGA